MITISLAFFLVLWNTVFTTDYITGLLQLLPQCVVLLQRIHMQEVRLLQLYMHTVDKAEQLTHVFREMH